MSRGVDKTIRVLVANRPKLMRELMISTISDQSDIEVVGEVQNDADIWEVIEQTRPDFLIVASDEFGMQPPSVCASILRAYPQLTAEQVQAALEYAARLGAVCLADELLIIMRAYPEKPRTVTGWSQKMQPAILLPVVT